MATLAIRNASVQGPTAEHCEAQYRLCRLLERIAGGEYVSRASVPCRFVEGRDVEILDVAVVPSASWGEALRNGVLVGSPVLIADVLGRSDKACDVLSRERISLANGCREFWMLDPTAAEVRVRTARGSEIYTAGMEIPVLVLNGERVAVDAIFSR